LRHLPILLFQGSKPGTILFQLLADLGLID